MDWIGLAFLAVMAGLMAGWIFLALADPEALFREEGKR
jgi:hypothetical protein